MSSRLLSITFFSAAATEFFIISTNSGHVPENGPSSANISPMRPDVIVGHG